MFTFLRPWTSRRRPLVDAKVAATLPVVRQLIESGNRFQDAGDLVEAKRQYDAALSILPHFPRTHINIGNVCIEMGDIEAGLTAYRRALEIDPEFAPAHFNLGNAFRQLRQQRLAITHYENALRIQPTFLEAKLAIGNALDDLGELDKAEACYRRVLDADPSFAQVHFNLGNLMFKRKDWSGALAAYRRVAESFPDDGRVAAAAYHAALYLCEWGLRGPLEVDLVEKIERNVPGVAPFAILNLTRHDGQNSQLQYLAARNFADYLVGKYLATSANRQVRRITKSRLRIGYLSADFHNHATMHLIKGVLANHDRLCFDIILYSYGSVRDDMTKIARGRCAAFRDIADDSDETAAQLISADEIDILVDLKGYTENVRLGICARRPAPILVNWLGYPGTMGHSGLADYVIGDRFVTPIEDAVWFSETLAQMPHCYQPNDGARTVSPQPSRRQAGLPETGLVFCNFNQSYKFTPLIFDAWCELLKGVRGSILWLLDQPAAVIENLRNEAKKRGVDPGRIVFAPNVPAPDHLGRLQLADLVLDTFPYTSHTTASDAIWAGVPIVTIYGSTFAGRVASSILHAMKLSELVATNQSEYLDIASALASNPEKLIAIRMRLKRNLTDSPLFDTARFTRDLEKIYKRMWDNFVLGRREVISFESL